MYLTYYIHLVGIKEVIECKHAWRRKLKKNSELKADYFLA
jgi:hypothetical protein